MYSTASSQGPKDKDKEPDRASDEQDPLTTTTLEVPHPLNMVADAKPLTVLTLPATPAESQERLSVQMVRL